MIAKTLKYLLPLLALGGLALAVYMVLLDNEPPPAGSAEVRVARAPYASYIAGAGLIEASTGNIAVGTPVSGIIAMVYVQWGNRVRAGEPLFKIDDRDLQAQLAPAMAEIHQTEARLAKSRYLWQIAGKLSEKGGMSEEQFKTRGFEMQSDQASLAVGQARLEQLKAEIERRTIQAPVAGRILRIGARPGEYAQSGSLSTPLMILGDDSTLYVRVDVEEYDVWRLRPTAAARAFVRGNPRLSTPLRFERIEPLVVPKLALTGDSAERTDTRVLQVIYSFEQAALRVYVGQQVDVFIEAPPVDEASGKNSGSARASEP